MWYRSDILKFAVRLLPPVLRGRMAVALVKAMVMPVVYVFSLLTQYRAYAVRRLDITCSMQYIEKALNDEFYLEENLIYLVSVTPTKDSPYFHFKDEGKAPAILDFKTGTPFYLRSSDEKAINVNFYVYVPSFLCTSLDANGDKYGGMYLRRIKSLLDYYKPAGRNYEIILYDYE